MYMYCRGELSLCSLDYCCCCCCCCCCSPIQLGLIQDGSGQKVINCFIRAYLIELYHTVIYNNCPKCTYASAVYKFTSVFGPAITTLRCMGKSRLSHYVCKYKLSSFPALSWIIKKCTVCMIILLYDIVNVKSSSTCLAKILILKGSSFPTRIAHSQFVNPFISIFYLWFAFPSVFPLPSCEPLVIYRDCNSHRGVSVLSHFSFVTQNVAAIFIHLVEIFAIITTPH